MLVDTSIWIDHLKRHDARLAALLDDGLVVTHPFVIGELACGNLAKRNEVLELIALTSDKRLSAVARELGLHP